MRQTKGAIEYIDQEGNHVEEMLMTYGDEERQQNEINRENAKLLLSPDFIKFDPKLHACFKVSLQDNLLFGYIYQFLKNSKNARFYCTSQQIAEIFQCSSATIDASMKHLEDIGLIKRHRKIKAGGGMIRFVTVPDNLEFRLRENSNSQFEKSRTHSSRNLEGNKNKINKNKINKNIVAFQKKATQGEVLEEFNLKEKLETMFRATDKRMAIIACYWVIKKIKPKNKDQYESMIKRELKASSSLKGYELNRVKETMLWLNQNADFKWTLETAHKYIDEDLAQIKQKTLNEDELFEEKMKKIRENVHKKLGQTV